MDHLSHNGSLPHGYCAAVRIRNIAYKTRRRAALVLDALRIASRVTCYLRSRRRICARIFRFTHHRCASRSAAHSAAHAPADQDLRISSGSPLSCAVLYAHPQASRIAGYKTRHIKGSYGHRFALLHNCACTQIMRDRFAQDRTSRMRGIDRFKDLRFAHRIVFCAFAIAAVPVLCTISTASVPRSLPCGTACAIPLLHSAEYLCRMPQMFCVDTSLHWASCLPGHLCLPAVLPPARLAFLIFSACCIDRRACTFAFLERRYR